MKILLIPNIEYYAILLAAVLGPLGDYFIKKSINDSLFFITIPIILWGILAPILWYIIYTHLKIIKVLTIFNPLLIILTASLGVFIFNESINTRTIFAIIFALIAICLGVK